MRWVIVALALGAIAACDGSVQSSDGKTADESHAASGGYTMEIRATGAEQSYVVIAPDGRTVGARAAEGNSLLMDATRAQALASEAPPEDDDNVTDVVSVRLPGFQMRVGGNSEDPNGDNGSVQMSIGGQQNVEIHANEGGPGDADDRAFVRITGADEDAARDFINDAEELSPAVKQQMLAELGLH